MATAPSPTYRVTSGAPVNAGRWPGGRAAGSITLDDHTLSGAFASDNGLPSWVNAATARRWGTIPGNRLSDVNPDPTNTAAWKGNSGQPAVVTAWGSAAIDVATGTVWVPTMGGHNDYSGNEVYKWLLNQETPAWSMVLAPSNLGSYTLASGTASAYSDGRPRSTHGYNFVVYIPDVGPALAEQIGVAPGGTSGSRGVISFDPSSGAASFRTASAAGGSGSGGGACFDATRGTQGSIWRRSNGTTPMQRYDVAADTWSNVGSSQAWNGQCSIAAHPDGSYILIGNGTVRNGGSSVSGGWCVFNPASGAYSFPTFSGSVTGGLEPGTCQPVWVPSLGCFCAWDNSTSRTLITTLTPGANPFNDAWTIGTLSVDGGNTVTPSSKQLEGTYGRFAYWSNAGIFVLFNSTSETGYFFKL